MNLKRRDKYDLIKFFVALRKALPKILLQSYDVINYNQKSLLYEI
jgi:hypothetical protein